jgi:hypothetical protein
MRRAILVLAVLGVVGCGGSVEPGCDPTGYATSAAEGDELMVRYFACEDPGSYLGVCRVRAGACLAGVGCPTASTVCYDAAGTEQPNAAAAAARWSSACGCP